MTPWQKKLSRLVILVGLTGSPLSAQPTLDAPCPLDCRGVPFSQALPRLAEQLNLPYILDPSVTPDLAQTRIRMFAAHLSGQQAIRWLARSAGLEAVIIEGTILIAKPERLPRAWRYREPVTTWTSKGVPGTSRPSQDTTRLRKARDKRANVNWIDKPLSGVLRDVSHNFGVDIVVHPTIMATQPLLQFEQAQADLDTVCDALAQQLNARLIYIDGAFWARPRKGKHAQETQPATSRTSGSPTYRPAPSQLGLARWVTIDRSVTSWQAFADQLARASDLNCRIQPPALAETACVEAKGSVEDVLNGAQMLGHLSWALEDAGKDGRLSLRINIRQSEPKSP